MERKKGEGEGSKEPCEEKKSEHKKVKAHKKGKGGRCTLLGQEVVKEVKASSIRFFVGAPPPPSPERTPHIGNSRTGSQL